jgi:hypothetical protein
MNRIFLIVSCLLLFSVTGRAQQDTPQQFDFMKQRKSPMMQNSMKMGMKMGVRSFWNGGGTNRSVAAQCRFVEARRSDSRRISTKTKNARISETGIHRGVTGEQYTVNGNKLPFHPPLSGNPLTLTLSPRRGDSNVPSPSGRGLG